MMSVLSNYASFIGLLLVCSVAINIGQADRYQKEVIKAHDKYVTKDGTTFWARKIGNATPTEAELISLKACLDNDRKLGATPPRAVIVTTDEGSIFFLEQKSESAPDYLILDCR